MPARRVFQCQLCSAASIATLWGTLTQLSYDNAHEWVLSHFGQGPCQDKDPLLCPTLTH
jgi:hypothetical protein